MKVSWVSRSKFTPEIIFFSKRTSFMNNPILYKLKSVFSQRCSTKMSFVIVADFWLERLISFNPISKFLRRTRCTFWINWVLCVSTQILVKNIPCNYIRKFKLARTRSIDNFGLSQSLQFTARWLIFFY